MQVYFKPVGQRAYLGHSINLPQNVNELAIKLPRFPSDITFITVKMKGKNDGTLKDATVRKSKVIIAHAGPPTFFFTLSAADMHWPELHSHFKSENENISNDVRRRNVINNPHIVD